MGQNDDFAALLKHFRTSRGLTQKELAAVCRISQGLISQLESGKKKPAAKILDRLQKALQLTPSQKSRLYLSAGFVESDDGHTAEIVASPIFRSVLAVLSDPMPNNLPGPLARSAVKGFVDGWHSYAQAKEKQYNREWKGTEAICEDAVLKLQEATKRLEAYLYDAMGSAALHLGNLAEAERNYQHVERLLPEVNDPYIEGQLLAHQGEILRFRSDWRASEQKFRAANKTFLDLDDKTKSAWIDKKLGVLYLMQSQWNKGNLYLERSEEVFRSSDNTYELAKTCVALGWGYTQKGDWRRALKYRREGFALSQEHLVMDQQPDNFLRMQGHVYLGLTLHQIGLLEEAREHLESAKTISDTLEEMHERSTILVGLAQLYSDLFVKTGNTERNWPKIIEEYCEIAAEETRLAGDRRRYARTLIYQATLYLKPGTVDQAIERLEGARRIFRALEHHYYLATVAVYLGQAFLLTGEYGVLDVCVEEGLREAQIYRFPYYRQLSELRVLKARSLCYQSDLEGVARQLAYALADAILFNRFQCEKIADQVVDSISCEDSLKKGLATWGDKVRQFFEERINRDKQQKELADDQLLLIEDVSIWLKKLRRFPPPSFPKRSQEQLLASIR